MILPYNINQDVRYSKQYGLQSLNRAQNTGKKLPAQKYSEKDRNIGLLTK